MSQPDTKRFCKLLNYSFQDESLLVTALTHRSANSSHNERLEFLGDSVLGLVISTVISEEFPAANEGELSRLRASLVKGATLSKIANELVLGDWILLGSGELKSGGFRRDSILADTLEAVFGAIYCDGGYEKARDVILHLYSSRLEKVDPANLRKDQKLNYRSTCSRMETRYRNIASSKHPARRIYKRFRSNVKLHRLTSSVLVKG